MYPESLKIPNNYTTCKQFRYLVVLEYNLAVKNVKIISKLADAQTELLILSTQPEHIQGQRQISAKACEQYSCWDFYEWF